jgi:hypothetical protein
MEHDNLLNIYSRLPAESAKTLLEFAQFLASKAPVTEEKQAEDIVLEPLGITRPEKESIVGSIKRLKKNYPMLDSDQLIDDTQKLMTQHLLKGKDLLESIDAMEQVFLSHYEKWLIQRSASS